MASTIEARIARLEAERARIEAAPAPTDMKRDRDDARRIAFVVSRGDLDQRNGRPVDPAAMNILNALLGDTDREDPSPLIREWQALRDRLRTSG